MGLIFPAMAAAASKSFVEGSLNRPILFFSTIGIFAVLKVFTTVLGSVFVLASIAISLKEIVLFYSQ